MEIFILMQVQKECMEVEEEIPLFNVIIFETTVINHWSRYSF